MQTHLDESTGLARPDRARAEQVLRRCVHCGFCNATCPTYAVTGNELDGPRGRIYLIKQALETGKATRLTQRHLDRCLTCMACETTCPSGVRYHELLDVGRTFVDARVRRPWRDGLLRRALRTVVSRPRLFALLFRAGRVARPLLPPAWRERLDVARPLAPSAPPGDRAASARATPPDAASAIPASVVTLRGCVQPTLAPGTNAAAARVLAHQGTRWQEIRGAGCCGALHFHFGDRARALRLARRNVKALCAALDAGARHVVSTASGCGAFIREYGALLADDPGCADDARRVSEAHRDLSQVLDIDSVARLPAPAAPAPAAAFHCPCTLAHGQGLEGRVPALLEAAGIPLRAVPGPSRCCGSAGAYAALEPAMAATLGRDRAGLLQASGAERILTANVGCQHHMARFTERPVHHWIEALAERIDGRSG
jgi:glycolate oxidase iron-sulfur subunit